MWNKRWSRDALTKVEEWVTKKSKKQRGWPDFSRFCFYHHRSSLFTIFVCMHLFWRLDLFCRLIDFYNKGNVSLYVHCATFTYLSLTSPNSHSPSRPFLLYTLLVFNLFENVGKLSSCSPSKQAAPSSPSPSLSSPLCLYTLPVFNLCMWKCRKTLLAAPSSLPLLVYLLLECVVECASLPACLSPAWIIKIIDNSPPAHSPSHPILSPLLVYVRAA